MRARGQLGFTLVELLVALAVLAVLASLGFRGLNSILAAQTRIHAEATRWDGLALLFSQLARDVQFAAGADAARSPVIVRAADADLVIDRLGEGHASQGPRRVGYRLRDGRLEYLVWPAPHGPGQPRAGVDTIVDGVSVFELRAMGPDGAWSPSWPVAGGPAGLPRALEASIVLASGERVTRLLAFR